MLTKFIEVSRIRLISNNPFQSVSNQLISTKAVSISLIQFTSPIKFIPVIPKPTYFNKIYSSQSIPTYFIKIDYSQSKINLFQ
jgi:hypothetical protein